MAQKVVTTTTLIDDLTNEAIESGKGETVKFALDNAAFEIDLNDKNAKEFRRLLGPYVQAARVAGRSTRARSTGGAKNSKEELDAARTWLRTNGHEVSDRGRIAGSLMELYQASK